LAQFQTFSAEPEIRAYLESLVARAYGEIHETRSRTHRFAPWHWATVDFPRAFRRRLPSFGLALLVTVLGVILGAMLLQWDPAAKATLLPFSHLHGRPSERVKQEETATKDRLAGSKTTFSTSLMTHNTQVSIFVLALGITYGIGTVGLLFYNGVILGAVGADYIMDGQIHFLLGWLLPHGVVEIPAILIGGQAGFVLAGALIGWGDQKSLRIRLREVGNDLMLLIFGAALLLGWAGIVEAFISQYHEPVIPYSVKIGFGVVELQLLILFLSGSGRKLRVEEEKASR
jgi:uncharacterized membrane protein SpoIIM required for sporulation